MSPRAAWRLEALGFTEVYDYVAGKLDWLANGLPTERSDDEPRAADVARSDVPTCNIDDRLNDVRRRAREAGWDTCVVVNEQNIVLGRIGRKALHSDEDARAEDIMAEGPSTVRPYARLADLVDRMRNGGLETALVTTADGRLVGVIRRSEAEERLGGRAT